MLKARTLRIACFLVPVLTTFSFQAQAAGYKLEFQSVSILAGSGEAAAVEDAGTNWYNPAGIVLLPQQSVISGMDVYAPTTFSGTTFAPSATDSAFDFVGSGNASSHSNTLIPSIHYVLPLKDKISFGLSVVPAWGFTENYGTSSILRYDLTRVYTKTLDLAPTLAYQFNNQWSIGAGPDFNYFSVQSSRHVRTQPLTTDDSEQRFTADSWETGFHAGVLFRNANDTTRIGLGYRSKLVHHLEGYSDFALQNIQGFESNDFTLKIVLPATTTLSGYQVITPRVTLLGTLAYDQWSQLKAYKATNVIEPGNPAPLINVILPQNMKNTLDASVGAHYKLNDQWMLRGSIKYLPTPTNDNDRDVNFPDGRKIGFNVGSRYQMTERVALDLIYGHVFVKQVPINITDPVSFATTNGHTRTHIDLFGAQVVVNI